MAKLTINLFGAAGQRTIEIQPKGGFPTRHIKIGTPDPTPLPEITPNLPKAQPAAKGEDPISKPRTERIPLGDPNEVRVRRVDKYTLKMIHVYTGEYTQDIPERCQAHADATGCVVHLYTATELKFFKPEVDEPKIDLQALLAKVDAILAKGESNDA